MVLNRCNLLNIFQSKYGYANFKFANLKARYSDISEQNRMPEVNFDRDKVHKYLIEQIKLVEKDNVRRATIFKTRIFNGRKGICVLASIVIFIYGYTMYSVSRETFLDDFDDPDEE